MLLACLTCYCRDQDPTLTFVGGRFVPAHSLASPAPPPPPMPPPLYVLYQTPPPPPHPPTPSPPPPWYAHVSACFPITTAAENEIEVDEGFERAVCPEAMANVWEYLYFSYLNPWMSLGYRCVRARRAKGAPLTYDPYCWIMS